MLLPACTVQEGSPPLALKTTSERLRIVSLLTSESALSARRALAGPLKSPCDAKANTRRASEPSIKEEKGRIKIDRWMGGGGASLSADWA